jgi:hypothetical protein
MPLSSANKAIAYEIVGLPATGTAVYSNDLTHRTNSSLASQPSWATMDLSGLVAEFEARLAAMSAATQTRVEAMLTEWDSIKPWSALKVNTAENSAGTIVDHEKTRELIRDAFCNAVGFWCPDGGWNKYTELLHGKHGAAGQASRGDR